MDNIPLKEITHEAQLMSDMTVSGDVEIRGMLAALETLFETRHTKRIVFDALDVILALLPDPTAKRREIYRFHEWLMAQELTGIMTAEKEGSATGVAGEQLLGFM